MQADTDVCKRTNLFITGRYTCISKWLMSIPNEHNGEHAELVFDRPVHWSNTIEWIWVPHIYWQCSGNYSPWMVRRSMHTSLTWSSICIIPISPGEILVALPRIKVIASSTYALTCVIFARNPNESSCASWVSISFLPVKVMTWDSFKLVQKIPRSIIIKRSEPLGRADMIKHSAKKGVIPRSNASGCGCHREVFCIGSMVNP